MQDHGYVVYRRQEGFRLVFKDPILATFTVLDMQGEVVASRMGSLKILDMSLKGAKVSSSLHLPAPGTLISLEFVIADELMSIIGELIWNKPRYKEFMYGISFDPDSYLEQKLLKALKKYAKQNKSSI